MTYNVHSCVGRDGKTSPLRIAEVIAQHGSDIVALAVLNHSLCSSLFSTFYLTYACQSPRF